MAAAAAAFGQGYIHKMLVFNLAPLIVSAGGDLSGGNTHTHTHICLPFTHTLSLSLTPPSLSLSFFGLCNGLAWFGSGRTLLFGLAN